MVFVAWYFRQTQQHSISDFFAAGKKSPWWLLGISMVATTFAADTPLAVTGIVASEGIAGNWIWWNLMGSALLTVFVFSRLWKRSGVLTDVEFIRLRYAGKPAAFLRAFRAIYLAFPINCIILGWVTVGMSKILTVITGTEQWIVLACIYLVTGIYIALAGIWGVLITDALQFLIAIIGSVVFAFLALDHVGGMEAIRTQIPELGGEYLSFFPSSGSELFASFLIWVSMAWWASWYPGAEPGGGGYVVQRVISARSERDAVGASLFFSVAHYALRPWPWIIVALVSLLVYPELADKEAGYPLLMKDILPAGWFGLLLVVFLSAFVSTVSTHVNWGASYIINDVYKPFVRPETFFDSPTDADRHYVLISRIATMLMIVLAIVISYFFDSVKGGWQAILSLGAGVGPVYLLRWLWWRINAWSEISAMLAAAIGSFSLYLAGIDDFAAVLLINTGFSSVIWVLVTLLTKPEPEELLKSFAERIHPPGPGWKKYLDTAPPITPDLLKSLAGVAGIISVMFGMHTWFFSNAIQGFFLLLLGLILLVMVTRSIAEEAH